MTAWPGAAAPPVRRGAVRVTAGVLIQSLALGLAEFRTYYSIKSWLSGWLVRMLAQVTFFASIGLLLHSDIAVRYLLIGNAVALICLESTIVVLSMAGERYQGTLELLVTSPVNPARVLLGKGLNWVLTGMVTSLLALALLPPLFGQPESVPSLLACLPAMLAIGLSSHFYGSALGSIMLRLPQLEWLVLNLAYLLVITFTGVNVPTSFWPAPLPQIASALPITHGLAAIRSILAGGGIVQALPSIGWELVVTVGWLIAGYIAYSMVVRDARRRGSLR